MAVSVSQPETPKLAAPAAAKRLSRVLLADDSPHAQRMGERILREEGYEVVSVTDGETALKRISDVDPDLAIVDVFLPGKNGFEVCRYLKSTPAHMHVRVVMTAGLLEVFDEDEARRAGADSIIRKPFEASVVLETIAPLVADAKAARVAVVAPTPEPAPEPGAAPAPVPVAVTVELAPEPVAVEVAPPPVVEPAPAPVVVIEPIADLVEHVVVAPPVVEMPPEPALPVTTVVATPFRAELDPELVRAAITVALDASMSGLVDEITQRVLSALRDNQ